MSYASSLRTLFSGVLALLLVGVATPAQAQMDDGELPKIDFSVNLMQSAQYLTFDDGTDPVAGFHRVRAGLNANVQFSENVSGLLMIEQEPNDNGAGGNDNGASNSDSDTNGGFGLGPSVDFAILNLQVTDELTIQTGTPVTGLMNFRGFSDGPVVQGNPLIGNSPADMITAGEGVKLIGSYDTFGFDFTVNRLFGEDLTFRDGRNTGVNIIAKARYTGSDMFKVGGGIATSTGQTAIVFANGDRENYNTSPEQIGVTQAGIVTDALSTPDQAKNTHASIPDDGVIAHADAKIMASGADIDLWGGYATQSDPDATVAFGGIGLKYDLTEDFYGAGRFTVASNQTSGVSEEAPLGRIQLGVGYEIYDKALWKVEYVRQTEPAGSPGKIGTTWTGVTTELSFNF